MASNISLQVKAYRYLGAFIKTIINNVPQLEKFPYEIERPWYTLTSITFPKKLHK